MPYLPSERKEALKKNINLCATPGDLNYLFTRTIINAFKNHPKYEMIHVLRRDFVTDPKHNIAVQQARSDFADIFTVADVNTAAALAFEEFYARIGRYYEDKKIGMNGDVEEYQELFKMLDAPVEEKPVEATNEVQSV